MRFVTMYGLTPLLVAVIVSLAWPSGQAMAHEAGFWKQFVIIDEGDGNDYYGDSLGANFDGEELGPWYRGDEVFLNGAEANTWARKDWNRSVEWVKFHYQIDGDGWNSVDLGHRSSSGNDDMWDQTEEEIKLTTLPPGTYDLEVYFEAQGRQTWHSYTWLFYDSKSPDYKAEFTISALNNPSSQSATAASSSQINLSWTRGDSGGDKDTIIFRSTSSTPPTLDQGTSYSQGSTYSGYYCVYKGDATSHNDSASLSAGTQYYYYFFAENYSYYSAGVSANATTWTTPGAPTITGITPGNGQLSVAFTAPASDGGTAITDYKYSTDDGSTWKSAGTTTSPIVITTVSGSSANLVNGTTYTVRIRAVNAVGDGTQSDSSTGTPRTTPTLAATPTSSNVETTTATLGGDVTATGGADITERGVYWSTINNFTPPGQGTKVSETGTFGTGTFTRDVTGLPSGSTVYFRSFAVNVVDTVYSVNQGSILTKPAAPNTPTSSSVGTTSFIANWNTVTGASGYRLDVATDSGFSSFVSGFNNKSVSGTSDTVSGLTAGNTYYVRVRAENATGVSANSGTLTQITVPPAPGTPTAGSIGTTSFIASWSAANGAASYRLDVATDSGFTSFVSGYNDKTVSSTSDTVSGLSAGITYYVRVRAVNSAGTSADSGILTTLTIPPAPTGVSASDGTSTAHVTVSWTDATGATSHEVYRNTANNTTSGSNLGAQTSPFNDTTADPGQLYYYFVRAVNASGNGAYSTSDTGYRRLATVGGVTATVDTFDDKIRIQWTDITGETGYGIWRNTADNSAGATCVGSVGANTTLFDDTTPDPATDYYYWVRGTNSTSESQSDFQASGTLGRMSAAVIGIWTGAGANGNWGTAGNWSSSTVPGASDDATFYTGIGSGTTITLDSARSIASMLFLSDADTALTFSGANALTIGAGGIEAESGSAAHSFANPIVLGASQTWDLTPALTVSGNISGSAALTKEGAGRLTLSGNNSFTGDLNLDEGIIRLQGNINAQGSGTTVVAAGTTLELNQNLAYPRPITLNGLGVGDTAAIDALTASTLSGAITLGSDARVRAEGSGIFNMSGGITAGAHTFYVANTARDIRMTGGGFSGSRTTDDGAIRKTGTAAFRLRPDSGLTGTIYLDQGTIEHGTGNSHVLPAGGLLVLANGTTYRSDGNTARTVAKATRIDGNVTIGHTGGTGALTLSGNMDLNGSVRTLTVPNANTISGIISDGGLTKAGAGNLTISGANTFASNTRISAGTLTLGHASALQDSTLDMDSGDSGTLAFGSPAAFTLGGLTGSRNIDMGAKNLSIGNNDGSTTYSGILSGSGAFTKIGTGTLTLSGANSFTGLTTVDAGTLRMSGANRLSSSSALSVSGGATFDLDGNNTTVATLAGAGSVSLGAGTLTTSGNGSTTYSGVASGTGGLTKQGSGTLTLTGANDFSGNLTISGGTVSIGSGGTSGVVAGNIVNNATLIFDRSNDLTYAGDISGSGTLTKDGAGTLTLSGTHTYDGVSTVSAGTLVMSGSASDSAFTVASGATLRGAGSVGNLTVEGTVDPGNTVGARATLNAAALNLEQNGAMIVDISAMTGAAGTDWDHISASGAITINATAGNPFVIRLTGDPSFTATASYTNVIMAGASVSGFDSDKFTVDLTDFDPNIARGSFRVEQVGNSIAVVFTPRLLWFPFTGDSPAPSDVYANLTVGDMQNISTYGTGDAGTWTGPSGTPYAQGNGGWAEANQALAKNFNFTITAAEDYLFEITGARILWRRTTAGPTDVGFRVDSTSVFATTLPDATTQARTVFISGQTDLQNITFRIDGWGTSGGGGQFRIDDVEILGRVYLGPVITVSGSLSDFGSVGMGDTSAEQSYTVSGVRLRGNITITAPTGFEISTTSGAGFTSSLDLTPDGSGVVSATTIYVRFAPDATGAFSGNITHASTLATTRNQAVSGYGLAEVPDPSSNIQFENVATGQMDISWTEGDGEGRIVVVRAGSAVDFVPDNGTDYTSGVNANFGTAQDRGDGNKIVYRGADDTFTLTGLTPATQYFVEIFEFNGSGATIAYNTVTTPTASRWTLSTEPENHVQSFVADNPSSSTIDLSWSVNAGDPPADGYLIVRRPGGNPSFSPEDGNSYSGAQGDLTSVTVVTPGTVDSVTIGGLSPETTYYFRLYPFRRVDGQPETFNYKTDEVVPSANETTLPALQIIDQFVGYSGNLDGENGGTGWDGAWSVELDNPTGGGSSASVTISSDSLPVPSGYPEADGAKVEVDKFEHQTDPRFRANRTFGTTFTDGDIYAAAVLSYEWNNSGVFMGISLMDGTTEKAFVGRPLQSQERFGADSFGGTQLIAQPQKNFYAGNDYLVIVNYDFQTRVLRGLIYNSQQTGVPPEAEPGTWDFEVVLPEGRISQITGIRIGGGNKGGTFRFDEVRVGNTWRGLLDLGGSDENETPTVQASQFNLFMESKTQFNVTVDRGNGANVLILAREMTSPSDVVNATPQDGQTYTANASFGSGTEIGAGNFVVYNGSEAFPSFILSNLEAGKTYHLRAFEYNDADGTKYLTSEAPRNPRSYTTLSPPTGVSVGLSGVTGTQLSWNLWNSRYVMVVYNIGSEVTFTPTDGVNYGQGAQTGGTILHAGGTDRTSTTHTGLTENDTIHYAFFSRNSGGGNHFYSEPVKTSITLTAPTLFLYDGFADSSGFLTGGGGTGWSGNWSVTDDNGGYPGGGSLPFTTAAAASGNKAVLWGDVNGRFIDATRTMNQSISSGTYYLSWRMNVGFVNDDTYAGLRLLDSDGNVKAFIGQPFTRTDLVISEYGSLTPADPSQGISGGSGNDYLIVVKIEFDPDGSDDRISAIRYRNGTQLTGEEPYVWPISITTDIGNIGRIRLSAGANSCCQVGFVFYDEIRMAQNWTEAVRFDGQNYRTMMEQGPTPELIYIGRDFNDIKPENATDPFTIKNYITDADLAANEDMDIAIRWTSPHGVFVTNINPSLNTQASGAFASDNGNIVPNFDPLRTVDDEPAATGNDAMFDGFIGENGDETIISYIIGGLKEDDDIWDGWDIDDGFFITVSAQTYPSSGAKVDAPSGGEDVPDRRAFTINMPVEFFIVDDDPEPPIIQGFENLVFSDAQMRQGITISGEVMDEGSGIVPDSAVFTLWNSDETPKAVFEDQLFDTRPTGGSPNDGPARLQFETLAHNLPQVPYNDNRIGDWALEVSVTDWDADRFDDEDNNIDQETAIREFTIEVYDDDPDPPVLYNWTPSGVTGPRAFWVKTNDTMAMAAQYDTQLRTDRRTGTGNDTVFTLSDKEINEAGDQGIRFYFGARDEHSGLSRGTTGDEVMRFRMVYDGNAIHANDTANFNEGLSDPAGPDQNARNVWTFDNNTWSGQIITDMVEAGPMAVIVDIPDTDDDRPNDREWLLDQRVGYLRVVDDDTRGPVIASVGVAGAYGDGEFLYTGFETTQGWPSENSSSANNHTWTLTVNGQEWSGVGANRTGLQPYVGRRKGLMGGQISWLQLPPIMNPGTLSIIACRAGTTEGVDDVDVRLEYWDEAGSEWKLVGTRTITDRYQGPGNTEAEWYQPYTWDVNLQGEVTLRLWRDDTANQVYFDELNIVPIPVWRNDPNLTVNWSEAVDDWSGIDEYRVVAPARDAVAPTEKGHGANPEGGKLELSEMFTINAQDDQGELTGYVFAIDDDNDRPNDRSMGNVRPFTVKIDRTPPSTVPDLVASTDTVDDPTTQFDLSWSTTDVGPDDPNSAFYPTWGNNNRFLLSPWKTYKVYYAPYDPDLVTEPVWDYFNDTFFSNNHYLLWDSVTSDSEVEDDSAPANPYSALDNVATESIRLYDLDFDQEYLIAIVGVDEAGNEGPVESTSWATNNTIRFAVTQGVMRSRADIEVSFPTNNNLRAQDRGASALYWVAAGQKDGAGTVTRTYDLIYRDANFFQETNTWTWQKVGTVQSNWFTDAEGQDAGLGGDRGMMRFYRASYQDRWRRTNVVSGLPQRPLASEDVYALHNLVIAEGVNHVGLHGVPYTNTFAGVFGTDTNLWPASNSAAEATKIEFYAPSLDPKPTEVYWFGIDGHWRLSGDPDPVTTTLQSNHFFTRGFSIHLPTNLVNRGFSTTNAWDITKLTNVAAMVWSPILKVPTNGPAGVNGTAEAFTHVIRCGHRDRGTGQTYEMFNLLSLNLPVSVHPSQLNLPTNFTRGVREIADQIYTIDTTQRRVRDGRLIYADAGDNWFFSTGSGTQPVPAGYFKPNDVIIIISRNGGTNNTWTWTYHPTNFYSLPTRHMGE